jgi:hypothetical protein
MTREQHMENLASACRLHGALDPERMALVIDTMTRFGRRAGEAIELHRRNCPEDFVVRPSDGAK